MYAKRDDLESGKITANEAAKNENTKRSVRNLLRRVLVMTVGLAVLVAVSAVVCYFLGWIFLLELVLVALVAYLAAGKWRWFYVALKTAPRDLR